MPEELTLEECVTLAENAPEKKGRWGRFGGGKKKEEVKVAPVKAARKPAPKKAAAKKAAVKIPAKKVAAKKVKKKELDTSLF